MLSACNHADAIKLLLILEQTQLTLNANFSALFYFTA